jgi:hypothetical protein
MSKDIYFIAQDEDVDILNMYPKPAKNYVPDWFKKMPNHHRQMNGDKRGSAKKCVPFVDSFTSGYIYELPCDVTIIYNGKDPGTQQDLLSYKWAGHLRPLSTRLEEFGTENLFPKFDGYYHTELHWNSFWEPKTPKGYSTMYHHPSNHFHLPFHTMTGIIDTDHWSVPGPVPFLIKEGFEGLIPAGTPIIQMTLIKREDWVSEKLEFDNNKRIRDNFSVRRFLTGGYKKQYWQRKSFR